MSEIQEKTPTQAAVVAGSAVLLAFALPIMMMLAFGAIAFSWEQGGWFESIDNNALRGAYWLRVNESWLTLPMEAITSIGYSLGYTIQTLLVTAFLFWRRPQKWRSSIGLLVVAMLGAAFLSSFLKDLWGRARPSLYTTPFTEDTWSFPSGHSLGAAVLYGSVALIACRSTTRRDLYWMFATLAAAVTVWMGFSRLFFSVHYPSDVIGGFLSGIGWLMSIVFVDTAIAWWRNRATLKTMNSSNKTL